MDPRLNIINNRLVNVRKIIAVSGGKGGIGKSITASTLALSLAKHGYRAGLLDLDFCGPSDHVILGVEGVFPKENQGIIPPEVYGIKLMSIIYYSGSSPAPLRGSEVSNAIIEMLAITLWESLDFLIMDLPPGLGDPILDIIRLIEKVEFLVVTTPSRLARAVVKKELQVLKELGLPIIGVLENMKLTEQTSVWEGVGKYGAPVLGSVNFDNNLEDSL
ncbi:MAG: P-loop NTPase, partial [Desulfotomaculaceae bacterium]|nr:P-loop NTPase [Desulfotomaculaceae bacterium]